MYRSLFDMLITVVTAITVYYLLSVKTMLPENLSMAGGVMAGILCAVALKRRVRRKKSGGR